VLRWVWFPSACGSRAVPVRFPSVPVVRFPCAGVALSEAAALIASTATGAITKNVSTSEMPITTSPEGASVAPSALRSIAITMLTFTKLVSINTTSGTIAANARTHPESFTRAPTW
jgi:hypothetical protein